MTDSSGLDEKLHYLGGQTGFVRVPKGDARKPDPEYIRLRPRRGETDYDFVQRISEAMAREGQRSWRKGIAYQKRFLDPVLQDFVDQYHASLVRGHVIRASKMFDDALWDKNPSLLIPSLKMLLPAFRSDPFSPNFIGSRKGQVSKDWPEGDACKLLFSMIGSKNPSDSGAKEDEAAYRDFVAAAVNVFFAIAPKAVETLSLYNELMQKRAAKGMSVFTPSGGLLDRVSYGIRTALGQEQRRDFEYLSFGPSQAVVDYAVEHRPVFYDAVLNEAKKRIGAWNQQVRDARYGLDDDTPTLRTIWQDKSFASEAAFAGFVYKKVCAGLEKYGPEEPVLRDAMRFLETIRERQEDILQQERDGIKAALKKHEETTRKFDMIWDHK